MIGQESLWQIVRDFLEKQEAIWTKLKKTKQRECVYKVLAKAGEPMSAAAIYQEIITENPDCGYAVSTVYRVLQAFEERQLVNRTNLPDSDMALYEWNDGEHHHYAICLSCHKKIPLKSCPFHHMELTQEEEEFCVTGHRIEVYGYCGKCKK